MFRFTTAGESTRSRACRDSRRSARRSAIDIEQINHELHRRQKGYGRGARMKIEQDRAEIISGVRHGLTLGSPLAVMIENKDWAKLGRRDVAREARTSAPRNLAASNARVPATPIWPAD